MLGYMTAKQAIQEGFTHHGSYYGIPLWILPDDDFRVVAKWSPMEYVMMVFLSIENTLRYIAYPNEEAVFQFVLKSKIDLT